MEVIGAHGIGMNTDPPAKCTMKATKRVDDNGIRMKPEMSFALRGQRWIRRPSLPRYVKPHPPQEMPRMITLMSHSVTGIGRPQACKVQ